MSVLHIFEVTYPKLAKSLPRPTLFPLQTTPSNILTLTQNYSHLLSNTNPAFSQNHPQLLQY